MALVHVIKSGTAQSDKTGGLWLDGKATKPVDWVAR
jgi:hypothetical protein